MNKVLMKQKLSLLLATLMLLIALPVRGANGDTFDYAYQGFNYGFVVVDEAAKTCATIPGEFHSRQTYSGERMYYSSGIMELPANPRNQDGTIYKLVAISDYSFPHSGMKELIIPEGVKTIGQGAFYQCGNLMSVVLPSTLTSIGMTYDPYPSMDVVPEVGDFFGAFESCTKLSSINAPASLKTIGLRTFYDCQMLTSFNFSNVSNIIRYAFAASGIKTVTLPAMTTLDRYAFNSCKSLTDVTINGKITNFGKGVFMSCSVLADARIHKTNVSIPDQTFYNCERLSSVSIPLSATSIGQLAFYDCVSLKDLNLSSCTSLREIKANAFRNCSSIATLSLPSSLTTIGDYAFYDNTAAKTLTLPGKLESIGRMAFYDWIGLTSLYVPASVKMMGYGAFAGCSSLTELTLAEGITEIPESAFQSCAKLAKVTLPSTLQIIGPSAFKNANITELTLPESVTEIGANAFAGQSLLKYVMYQTKGTIPAISANTFYINSGQTPLYVANGRKTAFKSAPGWSSFDVQEISIYFAEPLIVATESDAHPMSGPNGDQIRFARDLAVVSAPVGFDNVNYTSSNPGVAYVGDGKWPYYDPTQGGVVFSDKKGILLAGSTGTAVITATLTQYNIKATCTVTVVPNNFDDGTFTYSTTVSPYGTPPTPDNPFGTYAVAVTGTVGEAPEILNLPQEVTFADCTFPVVAVGGSSFSGKYAKTIKSIIIPSNIVKIEYDAFQNLPELESVYVEPRTGTWDWSEYNSADWRYPQMQGGVFRNCPNLKNVVWCAEYASVESYEFYNDDVQILVAEIADNRDKYANKDNFIKSEITVIPSTSKVANGMVVSADGKLTKLIPSISGMVSIPDTIPGSTNKITAIDANAFRNNSMITEVVLPSTITSIGASAFEGCSNLEYVNIPSAVTHIGNHAFRNSGITEIELSDNVTTTGSELFAGCVNLTSAKLGNKTGVIGNGMFKGCSKLGGINIPASVTAIGEEAFYNCSELAYAHIGSNVSSIGNNAFYGCAKLAALNIPNKVKTIGSGAFNGCAALTDVIVPNSVTSIGASAFANCPEVKNVIIGTGVTSLDNTVFAQSAKVDLAMLPAGVAKTCFPSSAQGNVNNYPREEALVIEDSGLVYTTGANGGTLIAVPANIQDGFEIPAGVKTIQAGAFKDCTTITSITIPSTVKNIEEGAFEGCTNLWSVSIEEGVETIGDGAFRGCTALETVTIPSTVATIGQNAFFGCENLTALKISEGVKTIGANAFSGCQALTEVMIPNSVTTINNGAFAQCPNIESVVVGTGVTSIGNSVFAQSTKVSTVLMPEGTVSGIPTNSEQTVMQYPKEDTLVIRPNGMIYTENAVSGGRLIKVPDYLSGTFTVPEGITEIGDGAFRGCSGITNVIFPENLTSIGDNAFEGCTNLDAVILPDSVNEIGSGAFKDCDHLSIVIAGSGLKTVGSDPFDGCDIFRALLVPDNISINANVEQLRKYPDGEVVLFDKESGLITTERGTLVHVPETTEGEFIIPDNINKVYYAAFENCDRMTAVVIPAGVTSIEENAFKGCTALEDVEIADGVTSIGKDAFAGCSKLDVIIIPNSVESIGQGAFSGCSDLSTIVIGSGVKTTGSGIFSGCENLSSVLIPEGLTLTSIDLPKRILLNIPPATPLLLMRNQA